MWQEKVINPQIIRSLFKDEDLSLERIVMGGIQFITGGTLICIMSYDLEKYLENPPAKWIARGCNTVQMQLSFIQSTVRRAELSGSNALGTLSIQVVETGFEVNYLNHENNDRLSLHCSWIHVDRVECYMQSC